MQLKLNPTLQKKYSKETLSALEAQRLAHKISFGPIVFQVSRLMKKFGILQILIDSPKGLTIDEISEKTKLSKYACQCLLESSLTIGTLLYIDGKFVCSKAGFFLLNEQLVDINMDFIHNVNYLPLFHLEETLLTGKPEGLKVFGNWDNIYEGLLQFPKEAFDSWFRFNHFYSDQTFDDALQIVFADKPEKLLDIGGNTGRWALHCVKNDPGLLVTILDLPEQIEMMEQEIAGEKDSDRISGYACNLLDPGMSIPAGFDVIWISQLLDNFSEEEIVNILTKIAESMSNNTKLYIMEMFWDRQPFETGAYILSQLSLYFTILATGHSRMYPTEEFTRFIEEAKLSIVEINDGIGKGHSIIQCRKK